MVLERTEREVIIRLPASVQWEELDLLLKFLRYKESVAQSKASQADIDRLASELNKGWWAENQHKFLAP